jgi:acyl carrier protein
MTAQQVSSEKTPMKSIESALMAYAKNNLNIEIQSPEHNLIEEGILDSFMLVDLVLYMEQEFNVSPSLEDLEIENFATVARMANFLAARGAQT